MIADTVYLNGEFLPLAAAKISPLDRGFLFGDGVYEVIPVYSRRPFRAEEHLARLQQSLDGIALNNPLSLADWLAVIARLIEAAPWDDQGVYLQVTRGADVKRDHAFPSAAVPPTVFAMVAPLVTPATAVLEQGVAAITAADNRWLRCNLKTTSLLANVLLRQQAVEADCAETILIRDGWLTEGSTTNVLIAQDGQLIAPPKSHLILPGVTYDLVLELAARHGLPHAVRPISEAELRQADEIWLTSSPKEVLAVTTLDGQPVGNGTPGPIGRQMWQWYQDYKKSVMRKG